MSKRAVVYIAWGEKYLKEVNDSIKKSKPLREYDIILITDEISKVKESHLFEKIIRATFENKGLLRKAEMVNYLPDEYDHFLYLDTDTTILKDISLGFEKANKYQIAMSPAPLYSIDYFWGFDKVLKSENVECKGQLLYNSGIIFFKKTSLIKELFMRWNELAKKYANHGDQPFLTLAMEQLDINPYTLSRSYNYRAIGEYIIGPVRVWHSRGKIPKDINENVIVWPPRRAWASRVEYFSQKNILKRNMDRLIRFFNND